MLFKPKPTPPPCSYTLSSCPPATSPAPLHFFPTLPYALQSKNAKLLTKQCASIFPTKAKKQDFVTTLFNSPVLSEIVRQSVLDISSARKRIICDSLCPTLHCKPPPHLLLHSVHFIRRQPKAFHTSDRTRRTAQKVSSDVYDFSPWRSAFLPTLKRFSPSLTLPFFSPPGPSLLSFQEFSQSSRRKVVIFRHEADPAVYDALLGSDAVSPIKTAIFALAIFEA